MAPMSRKLLSLVILPFALAAAPVPSGASQSERYLVLLVPGGHAAKPANPGRLQESSSRHPNSERGAPGEQNYALALDLSSPPGTPPSLTIARLRGNEDRPPRRICRTIDCSTTPLGLYRPLGNTLRGDALRDSPSRSSHYLMVVLSNPTAGQEAEYNRWYDAEHVPDVLRVPGVLSARCFVRLTPARRSAALPRYMVIYEVESADLSATRAEIIRRIRSGETRMSGAFENKTSITRFYSPGTLPGGLRP